MPLILTLVFPLPCGAEPDTSASRPVSVGHSDPPIETGAGSCGGQSLRLDGAEASAESGRSVAYVEVWTPPLEQLARCVSSLPGACVTVSGFADDVAFSAEVVRAFGSLEAAQLARGRARALTVMSKLIELGLPPRALSEGPATANAAFRGVTVDVVLECDGVRPELPEWARDPEQLTSLLKERGFVIGATETPTPRVAAVRAEPSPPRKPVERLAEPSVPPTTRPEGIWFGARIGETVPLGRLYEDVGGVSRDVAFHDAASTGLSTEIDGGARLGSHWLAFLFWERLWLGQPGSGDFLHYGGGQEGQTVDSFGVSLRATTLPAFLLQRIALAAELGVAYRRLVLTWADESELTLVSPAVLRVGLGAELPLGRNYTISTTLFGSAGVFTQRQLSARNGDPVDFAAGDALHGTLGLNIAVHFELPWAAAKDARQLTAQGGAR